MVKQTGAEGAGQGPYCRKPWHVVWGHSFCIGGTFMSRYMARRMKSLDQSDAFNRVRSRHASRLCFALTVVSGLQKNLFCVPAPHEFRVHK